MTPRFLVLLALRPLAAPQSTAPNYSPPSRCVNSFLIHPLSLCTTVIHPLNTPSYTTRLRATHIHQGVCPSILNSLIHPIPLHAPFYTPTQYNYPLNTPSYTTRLRATHIHQGVCPSILNSLIHPIPLHAPFYTPTQYNYPLNIPTYTTRLRATHIHQGV